MLPLLHALLLQGYCLLLLEQSATIYCLAEFFRQILAVGLAAQTDALMSASAKAGAASRVAAVNTAAAAWPMFTLTGLGAWGFTAIFAGAWARIGIFAVLCVKRTGREMRSGCCGRAGGRCSSNGSGSVEEGPCSVGVVPCGSWVRVFTEEYRGKRGDYTRRFLAASYVALYARHLSTQLDRRHLYEVITEGAPCHAYLDLEFSTAANPGVCGDSLVNRLVLLLMAAYRERWGITLRKQWVLELDSSTPTKFSRHLVIRVPGWAFASNADVGALVRGITLSSAGLATLYVFKDPPAAGAAAAGTAGGGGGGPAAVAAAGAVEAAGGAPGCWPAGGDGLTNEQQNQEQQEQDEEQQQQRARVCFVDGAVYSKNRHFRLFGSTKGGKSARLEPTLRYCMSAACRNALPVPQHKLFLMGLICNVAPGTCLLDMRQGQQQQQQGQGQQQGGQQGFPGQQQQQQDSGCGGEEEVVEIRVPPPGGVPGAGPASYRAIKLTLGPQPNQQQLQDAAAAAPHAAAAQQQQQQQRPVFLDPVVLRQVLLGAVGFVEEVAAQRARQMRPPELQGADASVQVRTIFPVGANRGAPACTQHAAYAFSLLGPGSHACGCLGRDHRSNYVFFVLDFSCSGFSGGSYCQKCYDPDCRGYRSPWAPLPAEVWQQQRLAETAAAWQQRQQLLLLQQLLQQQQQQQQQEGPQQDEERQRPQDEVQQQQ